MYTQAIHHKEQTSQTGLKMSRGRRMNDTERRERLQRVARSLLETPNLTAPEIAHRPAPYVFWLD